jgi:hypothetical protein
MMTDELPHEATESPDKEPFVEEVQEAGGKKFRPKAQKKAWLSSQVIIVALAFGGAALAVVLAGIGASLTGPAGGIIVGILAGIAEPDIPLASMLAHTLGGIFNGFVYKKVTWRFSEKKFVFIALWIGQVLIYYFIIVVPLFAIGTMIFYPDPEYSFSTLLNNISLGVVREVILTVVISSIIMLVLPRRHKRPLW